MAIGSGFSQTAGHGSGGIDLTRLDTAVRPQDDLYRYVNGGWLAATEVPADRVYYDAFIELADKVELDLRAIIEDTTARRHAAASRQIGDLYASMMNEDRIEALGATPIKPELQKIDAIRTPRDLAIEAGYLSSIATGGPFPGTVDVDSRRPGVPIARIGQGGTLLPERDYYLNDAPKFADARAKYEEYLTRIFTLTDRAHAAADARAVLAIETPLARAQWTLEDSRDPIKTNNTFSLARLSSEMPGFDWMAWARPQGIDLTPSLVLLQPSFFKSFAALVPAMPLDGWKAWLAARYITASAPYLSSAFSDARFDFFGRFLTGQEVPRVRWKRAVGLVNGTLGDAVGRLYVERHFSPLAKTRVDRLVANVLAAFRQSITGLDWMSAPTKSQALDKLERLSAKIGAPAGWRSYGGLEIKPDDLIGNMRRAQQFENARRMAAMGLPVDRTEWPVTPQTTNAFHKQVTNEIVLPAAILQPPFFNVDADEAVNYGSIGAIVGHELGHAFDDRGRWLDGAGVVRNWWKPQDEQQFEARARVLTEQVNTFRASGAAVDIPAYGERTLSENLGDLSGLSIAYKAYHLSLGGRPAPVIDGFTGDQRFFIGWAQVWRAKVRPAYLRQWLLSSPHALAPYRANIPPSNMAAFYEAFGVTPADNLYRNPDRRVRMW